MLGGEMAERRGRLREKSRSSEVNHGWDICPIADERCPGARDQVIFTVKCTEKNEYVKCKYESPRGVKNEQS